MSKHYGIHELKGLRNKVGMLTAMNKILRDDNDRKSRELAKIKSTMRAWLNAPEK